MAEPQGSGDHIEELLGQLKGIFGRLSETDQDEAAKKITPPPESPPPAPVPEEPKAPPPAPEPVPPAKKPEPPPVKPPEPVAPPEPAPAPKVEPMPPPSVPEKAPPPVEIKKVEPPPLAPEPKPVLKEPVPFPKAPQPAAPAALPGEPAQVPFTPNEVTVPAGATLIPTAVFYPAGKLADAKIVIDKVEKITPKFTKVAVVLNVRELTAFDVKSDLKAAILAHIEKQIRAVFVLIDKPMDETRRKALIAELEPKGVYFQEIPSQQMEKKALYTDMLLGMVFFFDSQKPKGDS